MCTSTKKISLVEILSQTPRQTMPVFFTSYITANTALYAFPILSLIFWQMLPHFDIDFVDFEDQIMAIVATVNLIFSLYCTSRKYHFQKDANSFNDIFWMRIFCIQIYLHYSKMFERDLLMLGMLMFGIDLTGDIVRCEYYVPDSSARLIYSHFEIFCNFFEFVSIFCAVQSESLQSWSGLKLFPLFHSSPQLYVCFKQIKNSCQKSTSKRSRIESLVAQMLKDNDARFFFVSEICFCSWFFFQQPLSFLVCQYVCSTKKYILTENLF